MPDKIGIYDVGDHYEPSESEGEYDEREQRLLKDIRDRRGRKAPKDDEEEVLGFDDEEDDFDDEDDDDEVQKFEHDSDIEDKEDDDDLPNRKAWGSKARGFYGADYVDQDYDSLTAQEEERAQLEEIEAKEIQQRLAKELNEADFSLDVFVAEPEAGREGKKKKDKGEIKLKTDLSDLSERQKRELFRKEAPEFDGLVEDFEKNLVECQDTMEPVLKYLKEHGVQDHPFVCFLKTRYDLALSYCNNISFYLLLKSKKIKVKNHPVVKRMVQMKQLLLELDQKYETSIQSQVEQILKHIESGEELIFDDQPSADKPKKAKKKLAMLRNLEASEEPEDEDQSEESDEEDDDDEQPTTKKLRLGSDSEEEQQEDDEEAEVVLDKDGKRKITYQMAKNKGLTAHKRKEQRNIRVKNRRKFQKALVRRKGAIRPVKTETTRYAGEAGGIKAFVKRSVKLK
ncbi:something about silencing protein 10 [Culex quinquefasciatus]|uniref:Something about silencing protein 10 n=1 Tax=Culex quinquefasciatus TaxID=7176 RepID=B0X7G1_CULQU|nr:something about silencing protein 10 [Culex quinquefasciatus]|eukprot:XP_001865583.1 something about silencing protein 10 [Culex quinquefasciatus]